MKEINFRSLILTRYPKPEWVVAWEVTEDGQRRRADAVAVNLWKSRGREIIGLEIKVRRSDWLKELRDPAKSAPMQRYCHRWIVVAPRGLVRDGELPPTWGLLEPWGKGLRFKTRAPKLEPEFPADERFFCPFLRSLFRDHDQEFVRREEVEQMVETQVEQRQRWRKGDGERAIADLEALSKKVHEFEQASGVFIRSGWQSSASIGHAVRLLTQAGDRLPNVLSAAQDSLKRQMESLKKAEEEVRGVLADLSPAED